MLANNGNRRLNKSKSGEENSGEEPVSTDVHPQVFTCSWFHKLRACWGLEGPGCSWEPLPVGCPLRSSRNMGYEPGDTDYWTWIAVPSRSRYTSLLQKVETTATVSPSICVPFMAAAVTRISSSLLTIKLKGFFHDTVCGNWCCELPLDSHLKNIN